MNELDQATLNLRYAQAQQRRMDKLEKENKGLREIVEALRVHMINLAQPRPPAPPEVI